MTESSKSTMTPTDAARIQSHADRTGTNQGFKSRAQGATATPAPSGSGQQTSKGGSGQVNKGGDKK